MSEQPLELNIAFFGARGAGKTCLVSSFYGYQQSADFMQSKGYGLCAGTCEVDTALTQHFKGISDGRWPLSSSSFKAYAFDFVVTELSHLPPVARVNWLDYPGDWWHQTLDPSTSRQEAEEFARVLKCDVAFLLVDGARYAQEGARYLQALIPLMKRQFERHRQIMVQHDLPVDSYPRRWILALAKADLMAPDYGAREFHDEIERHARAERDQLARAIHQLQGMKNDRPEVLFDYMVLSALPRPQRAGRSVPFGMELITPVALFETLEAAVERAKKDDPVIWMWLSRVFGALLKELPRNKQHLPPQLHPIVDLVEKLKLWENVEQHGEQLEKERQQAIAKQDVLKATYLSMLAELKDPLYQRAYFQPTAQGATV